MKKLNTWINYLKLMIVTILFLLGSMVEPLENKATLLFLLSALTLTATAEFLLIKERQRQELRYAKYINELEKVVEKEVRDSKYAA